jgi:hypothetical protein
LCIRAAANRHEVAVYFESQPDPDDQNRGHMRFAELFAAIYDKLKDTNESIQNAVLTAPKFTTLKGAAQIASTHSHVFSSLGHLEADVKDGEDDEDDDTESVVQEELCPRDDHLASQLHFTDEIQVYSPYCKLHINVNHNSGI